VSVMALHRQNAELDTEIVWRLRQREAHA
jgi:hypothetical protein